MFSSSNREKCRQYLADGVAIVASALLFSAGMAMFIEPAQLIMGGVTGIATAINIFFGGIPPIGVLTLLINIPMLLGVWKVYGFKFIVKTVIATVLVSLSVDFFQFWPVTVQDPLLCAIFGGIITGISLGLLFSRGYNTGGTDLLVYLIRRKFKRFSAGMIVLITDSIIVLVSAIALQSLEMVFYSAITIYVQSKTIDLIVSGVNRARAAFIISEKEDEIAEALANRLERGVTVLSGRGYYTGKEKDVLLCAVSTKQVYRLKTIIHEIDPNAFVIITDASEISGYGFEKRSV